MLQLTTAGEARCFLSCPTLGRLKLKQCYWTSALADVAVHASFPILVLMQLMLHNRRDVVPIVALQYSYGCRL